MASDLPSPVVDERQRRAQFAAGLRSLARFIETTDAPVYLFDDSLGVKREIVEVSVHVHDAAEYEAFKRRYWIDGDDAASAGGFVHAVRHFGPYVPYVTYGVQRSTR